MATNFDFAWYEKNQRELTNFLEQYVKTLELRSQSSSLLTYSFYSDEVTLPSNRYVDLPSGESGKTTPFTDSEKQAFRAMVEYVSRFVDLEFREVLAGTGDIRVLHANTTWGGYATYPTNSTYQILIINDGEQYFENSKFLSTLWHEFGHNLGLKHPNSYQASDSGPFLSDSLDSELLSVMTYNSLFSNEYIRDTTFASLDLHTLRLMYGESNKSDGLRWQIIKKDDQQIDTSNLQDFSNNEFTFSVNHKQDLVWVYGTANQDVLDVSRLIGIEDNTGLLIDLQLGTISTAEIDWHPNIQIYDYKNKSWVTTDLNELPEIRIFPESDLAKRIDSLILTSNSDSVILGDYIDKVFAGDGDDIFYGFETDMIDGGDGIDRWITQTTNKEFKIEQTKNGIEVYSHYYNNQITIQNMEFLDFLDSKYVFEQSDVSKQAYRIYKAAFDRTPDLEGVGYWINDIKNGASLETVAGGFIASEEFLLRYGSNTNDNEFIKLLYENVLDRQPDSAGYQYWQNDMSNGMTREKMLINFSESQENINNVSAVIQGGVLYMDWIT